MDYIYAVTYAHLFYNIIFHPSSQVVQQYYAVIMMTYKYSDIAYRIWRCCKSEQHMTLYAIGNCSERGSQSDVYLEIEKFFFLVF